MSQINQLVVLKTAQVPKQAVELLSADWAPERQATPNNSKVRLCQPIFYHLSRWRRQFQPLLLMIFVEKVLFQGEKRTVFFQQCDKIMLVILLLHVQCSFQKFYSLFPSSSSRNSLIVSSLQNSSPSRKSLAERYLAQAIKLKKCLATTYFFLVAVS